MSKKDNKTKDLCVAFIVNLIERVSLSYMKSNLSCLIYSVQTFSQSSNMSTVSLKLNVSFSITKISCITLNQSSLLRRSALYNWEVTLGRAEEMLKGIANPTWLRKASGSFRRSWRTWLWKRMFRHHCDT